METMTLQGPVVILPADDYRNLLDRVSQLEKTVGQLAHLLEDLEDVQAMRQTEIEYKAGDGIAFDELLSELEAEADNVQA